MKRLLLAALLLTACAPTALRQTVPAMLQASFSSAGVLWSEGGKVTLARAPAFQKVQVKVPAGVTAVGWQVAGYERTPWVALGQLGLLLTADGRPVTVQAGRVVALSGTRAYREDGSTAGYDGGAGSGLLGRPDAVVTGGDGADYAVQNGSLYRLGGGAQTLLSGAAQPYLYADLTGAATANAPTAITPDGRYVLTGTALERRDAAGVLLASLPHPVGLIGVIGNLIVTLQPGGTLRFFAPDLKELRP
ncbi:hypothetical protein Q0M94_00920 [Deinococcus radiomollis]|uniref:hypothetical protein n=1 Tax=Deinococcus radiomollis TaxID=468916 RepID=UPI0038919CE9